MNETTNQPDTSIKIHQPMTHEESMALPKSQYLERCRAWLDEFNDGKQLKLNNTQICPVQAWILHNNTACKKDMVSGIVDCEICGEPACPECGNHNATQLSRVTGYIQDVSGWNAGKRQELKMRQRHNLMD